MTPVLFRAERSGELKGLVTAVFPTMPADAHGYQMTCYAHVGQHSGCSFEWFYGTRPATPAEYADLLTELKSIGYDDLKVCKRITRNMRDECRREAAA
jgi:hypothetical protein